MNGADCLFMLIHILAYGQRRKYKQAKKNPVGETGLFRISGSTLLGSNYTNRFTIVFAFSFENHFAFRFCE